MGAQDDDSWRRLLKRGPDRYYEEDLHIYRARLCSYVFELVKNEEDAKDIVQEALLNAYLALRRYFKLSDQEHIMKPWPWLRMIAIHVTCDHWKHVQPIQYTSALQEIFLELEDTGNQPERLVEKEESRQELIELLSMLPDRYQAVIQLRYFQSLSYGDLAERLNCQEDTARQIVHRALTKLLQLCNKTRKVR